VTPPQAFATPLEEKHQIINEETFIPPPPPLLPSPPPYIYSDIKSFNLNIAASSMPNNHSNAIQNDHSPPSFSSSSSCSSSSSPSSSSSSASAQSSSSSSCNFSHSQTNKTNKNSTSRALSPSHLLARPLPPAPLPPPPTQFTHNDKEHLLTEISKITDVTPTRPNNLTSKSKSPRPPQLDQSNVELKNNNKNNNQFLLNNSHFVVSDTANNQHIQNYTNVTIWREELNAKNNVQQQIKKQVGLIYKALYFSSKAIRITHHHPNLSLLFGKIF
jgi:hypothetical protein